MRVGSQRVKAIFFCTEPTCNYFQVIINVSFVVRRDRLQITLQLWFFYDIMGSRS